MARHTNITRRVRSPLAAVLAAFALLAGCNMGPVDPRGPDARTDGARGGDAQTTLPDGAVIPATPDGSTSSPDASTSAPDGALPTTPDGSTTSPDSGTITPTPDSGTVTPPPPPPEGRRVIGYFAAWSVYGRNYHVTDIPGDRLTHINYAFANISEAGECVLGDPYADIDRFYPGDTWDPGALRGSFHQLQLLKARNPRLRTLISVGGWTWSGRFSDVALTAASRERFAASCVRFMRQYGFDGIDIDWEYPVSGGLEGNRYRPEDRANYTLLLGEIRRQLEAEGARNGGAHYLLTIAAPASPSIIANIEVDRIMAHLDWVNLMSYDFHGGWDTHTNFNAPLYAATGDPTADPVARASFNTDAAVSAYLSLGVEPNRLVMGVPFYGRGWSGVSSANNGLFQRTSGLPMGTYENGVFDYHDLAARYIGRFTRHWHAEAQVPWLYDNATGVMISYDDPESLGVKADYIVRRGLGGAMFWELSGDERSGTLLNALNARLR